jgi:hypothetical protein
LILLLIFGAIFISITPPDTLAPCFIRPSVRFLLPTRHLLQI